MSTPDTSAETPAGGTERTARTDSPREHIEHERRAEQFTAEYPDRPIRAAGPTDTSPIALTPARDGDLDPVWKAVVHETRTRGNDIHLPISLAYAERLCRAYPDADAQVVRVATLLHDTGWAHVDETRIISEGFGADWRSANIRYEHERAGCEVTRRVLPGLGYSGEFIDRVCQIIDGHDTRAEAYSLEDALMRDADRLWRFDQVGIALASSWFDLDPATYIGRLHDEILQELITQAALDMATADLARSEALLKTAVLR